MGVDLNNWRKIYDIQPVYGQCVLLSLFEMDPETIQIPSLAPEKSRAYQPLRESLLRETQNYDESEEDSENEKPSSNRQSCIELPVINRTSQSFTNLRKRPRPLLTFKILYYDRETQQSKKQIIKARSSAAVVFRYEYYSVNGYENRTRSELRFPPCRVCGARKPCKGGNTTEMLRHLRNEHSELQKLLEQKFKTGVKDECYFINLFEYSDKNIQEECNFNQKQKDYQIEESSNEGVIHKDVFDEYQNQRRKKYLYAIKQVNSIFSQNKNEELRPRFSHQEGIFDDFPRNTSNRRKQLALEQLERGYLAAQKNMKTIKMREEEENDKAYFMGREDPVSNMNFIECQNEEDLTIGRIYYTKQAELILFGMHPTYPLLICHIEPYLHEKPDHPSFVYLCTQNQNGNPVITVALSLINWKKYSDIEILLQKVIDTLFPISKWPSTLFYCGFSLQIREHVINFYERKKGQFAKMFEFSERRSNFGSLNQQEEEHSGNNCQNKRRKQERNADQKEDVEIYFFPWQALFKQSKKDLKYLCTKVLIEKRNFERKQMKKSPILAQKFIGSMLTSSFFISLQQIIQRPYRKQFYSINNFLDQIFYSNIIQDLKQQCLTFEMNSEQLFLLDQWPTLYEPIKQIYGKAFKKDLVEFRKRIYPKNYKRLIYMYLYAVYSLVAYSMNSSEIFEVIEHTRKNSLKKKLTNKVQLCKKSGYFQCQCRFQDIIGLPCAHIIRIFYQKNSLMYLKRYFHPKWNIETNITLELQLDNFYRLHEQKFCVLDCENEQQLALSALRAQMEKKIQVVKSEEGQEKNNERRMEPSAQNFKYFGIINYHIMQYLVLWS